jgi:NAD(P)-dependent dehydrogenase (short-subunit alcohol dehydrogenase family)
MAEGRVSTLITGASSGIGRATALRLSCGRSLILHGRDVVRLEETRQACLKPDSHLVWPFKLSDVASLADSLTNLLSESGVSAEAFVHCAGMVEVLPMRSTDHSTMLRTMTVNFLSAAEIVNVLLKKRVNNRELRNVVFISSIYSRFGARGHSAYAASKAALDGLMRTLAVELAPSVRVNSILPGAVPTPMAEESFSDPEILDGFRRNYPLGIGAPDNIADAVEFLLSEKARWMTGQEITVDGGRTVNMSLK